MGSERASRSVEMKETPVPPVASTTVATGSQPAALSIVRSTAELLQHEGSFPLREGRIQRSAVAESRVIRRFVDIPTLRAWKTKSAKMFASRSAQMKAIDVALGEFHRASGGPRPERTAALEALRGRLRHWETAREFDEDFDKGRGSAIEELIEVVDREILANRAAHDLELAPLVGEYRQAITNNDLAGARRTGAELCAVRQDLFVATVTEVLAVGGPLEFATALFGAPVAAVGMAPLNAAVVVGRDDYTWMTTAWANEAVDALLVPLAAGPNKAQTMLMLQHTPFREAVLANATGGRRDALMAMPMVRIAAAAGTDADQAKAGDVPTIRELADAAFHSFLGDQPNTNLGYATNSGTADPTGFMVGSAGMDVRAPCMSLSNMMTQVFKAVLPSGDPGAHPEHEMRPLLTKKLASIGNVGILTRDANFNGNVDQFGDEAGYATVNRIFFGDGHEWLVVGDREYDPTLGVTGAAGTIRALVEPLTFDGGGDAYTSSAGHTVRKTMVEPPGGGPLLFDRTVTITNAG